MPLFATGAEVRGLGEIVLPLKPTSRPATSCWSIRCCRWSPPTCSAASSGATIPGCPTLADPLTRPAQLGLWLGETRNDLEPPAVAMVPVIGELLARLGAASGCILSRMSGSGATVFGLFGSAAQAHQAAHDLRTIWPDYWVAAAPLGARLRTPGRLTAPAANGNGRKALPARAPGQPLAETDLNQQTMAPPSEADVPAAEFRRGIKELAPVVVGTLPYALVLGAQASQKGLNPTEMLMMAGLNFAGGSEFAAIQLWTSPPNLLLIAAVTLLINSRHILMGAALTPFIRHLPKRQALAALFVMVDETWALSYADAEKRAARGVRPGFSLAYYMGTAAALYVVWTVCTTLGALIGPVLGDIESYGFDMAFPAVFLVLIAGMWKGVRAARPWLVSLVVAALFYLFVPGAWFVAAGALSGVIAAYIWAPAE